MCNTQALNAQNVLMGFIIMLIGVNKLVPYAKLMIDQQENVLHVTKDGPYLMEVVLIQMQQLLLFLSVLSMTLSKMNVLCAWIITI